MRSPHEYGRIQFLTAANSLVKVFGRDVLYIKAGAEVAMNEQKK